MSANDFVIHSELEICGIRRAAELTARVRDQIPAQSYAGMSTWDLDELAGRLIAATGGRSAFLGYRGFPGQICISLNDEVVHGIGTPRRILRDGDLVSIDVGINYQGFIGDTALSFIIGEAPVSNDVSRLLSGTMDSLLAGIRAARAGNYVRDISRAVERVAKSNRLAVVREYVGHGCGVKLHEPPEIPNYVVRDKGPRLRPGMVLAIEPMLNLGTHRVITASDGWTVSTVDGKLSAHFEHMVLITDQEPEILTWPKTM